MFTVPPALVGVVPTLSLTGTSLNDQSVMGSVMLIGIVVNNAIVLVDYANLKRREEWRRVTTTVLESARLRLQPILMTTATTVLGMLPLAIGGAGARIRGGTLVGEPTCRQVWAGGCRGPMAGTATRAVLIRTIRNSPPGPSARDSRHLQRGQTVMTIRPTRRTFLKTSAVTGAALSVGALPLSWPWSASAADPLRVLILGGTGQTGPHLVRELLARGHAVTLFNRGNRSEDLFPDVECLIGDRDPEQADGLDALKAEIDAGREWDICIDIWPHIPRIVENTAKLLQASVGHFCYVSSISVYVDNSQPNADESAEVGQAPDADETEFTWDLFGPFKAECENRVRRLYPDNHTVFRPGLIVGPRDFSYRGGYWPVRVRQGGEVLAPGDGETPIQIIDGRDLTAFQVGCMEKRTGGTFDVTGPEPKHKLTMKAYLEECRQATGSDATFTWADSAFLEEHEVSAWMDMPCWLPPEGEYEAFGLRSCAKAVSAGLTYRSYAETIKDTLVWLDELPDERREGVMRRAGLPAEKEAAVLAAWHEAKG